MIEVFASRLSDATSHEMVCLDDLLPFLSRGKREKIIRFLHRDDALRSLLGEWMIRTLVRERLGLRGNEIVIETDAFGKPYLSNRGDFHFNIAHSGNWVVCAIAEHPVGIDVEKMRPIEEDVVISVLTKEEHDEYLSKSGCERLGYFYEMWTLKESIVKAAGMGLSLPLDEVRVRNGPLSITAEVRHARYYLRKYSIDEDYRMAACGTYDSFAGDIVKLPVAGDGDRLFY
jgi:4'-phosphopantetheinyl transferase